MHVTDTESMMQMMNEIKLLSAGYWVRYEITDKILKELSNQSKMVGTKVIKPKKQKIEAR